jgi:hypothetical protein
VTGQRPLPRFGYEFQQGAGLAGFFLGVVAAAGSGLLAAGLLSGGGDSFTGVWVAVAGDSGLGATAGGGALQPASTRPDTASASKTRKRILKTLRRHLSGSVCGSSRKVI